MSVWLLALVMPVQAVAAPKSKKPNKILIPENANLPPKPNSALCFFYRTAEWVDNFLLQGIDTNYVTLPEHSWRLALNGGVVGINSRWTAVNMNEVGTISLFTRTMPSAELGFNAGYRGFGFGYSWDLLNAYSRNMNISLGSKRFGLDFSMHRSARLGGEILYEDIPRDVDIENPAKLDQGFMWITNTNLSAWFALNATHYSHQAAIKQSYIQKRTAGSLLLSLSYLATDMAIRDTMTINGIPVLSYVLLSDVTHIYTHQVALGLGYGINYTPNRGKFLLHCAAYVQLVCYSINQITIAVPDTIKLPSEPRYSISPAFPVHITGNMRAALSWEINPWVHLSLWAQVNNIRFTSADQGPGSVTIKLSNWNWQTHLTLGVRFGAGAKRVKKVLDDEEEYLLAKEQYIVEQARKQRRDTALVEAAAKIHAEHAATDSISMEMIEDAHEMAKENAQMSAERKHRKRASQLPQWITDYFFSPYR